MFRVNIQDAKHAPKHKKTNLQNYRTINNKRTPIIKRVMKKVSQFPISLELWKEKLPNYFHIMIKCPF